MTADQFDRLMAAIDALSQRVRVVEEALHARPTPAPVWPSIQPNLLPFPAVTPPPFFPPNICSKCGLRIESVMGYCCARDNCPVGLGPVTS